MSLVVIYFDLAHNRIGMCSGFVIVEMLEKDGCVVSTLLLANNLLGL